MSAVTYDHLEPLLEGLADLQLTLNEEWRVADLSVETGALRHLDRDLLVGRQWAELFRSSDGPAARDILKTASAHPGRAYRADLTIHLVSDEDPIPVTCWLCTASTHNVTTVACVDLRGETNLRQQLINAQRTLEQDYWSNRRLEARYRRMLEMAAEGFLVIDDLSGRILEANNIAAVLLEQEEGTIVGRVFPIGLDPDGSRTLSELQREARSTTAVVTGNISTQSGKNLELAVTCLRQGNETRLLIRLSNSSPDTKDSTPGAESFEKSPDGILITDGSGTVMAANSSFLEMASILDEQQATGRRADRWLGRSIVDLDVILSNVRTDRSVQLFSSVLRTEQGASLDIELSAVEANRSGKRAILMFIRDVSRRINHEQTTEVHLPRSIEQITGRVGRVPLKQLVRESTDVIEALCIEAALKLTQDNRAAAAELLGLSRQSLYTKLRRFDIGDSEDTFP